MKNSLSFFIFCLFGGMNIFAQVGINTDNSPPDPSSGLDVNFSKKGFLPPRVILTSINASDPIVSPAVGLHVYNTAKDGTPPNNVMPGDYYWSGTQWIRISPPDGTNSGDMLYWNGTQWVSLPVGLNGQVLVLKNGIPKWSQPTSLCGISITINHVAGDVAPVNKTVTYGTVTNIPGENSKCWITSNLGADHQAIAVDDATEASAGWYWQFNRKQGYKYDATTRTPNTAWINSISESSDWTAANDPCTLELGSGWRIPTSTEWTNVDAGGTWADTDGPWNSGLKIHLAGYLFWGDGVLGARGYHGCYWSSTQDDLTYSNLFYFFYNFSSMTMSSKANGFSIRCIRD